MEMKKERPQASTRKKPERRTTIKASGETKERLSVTSREDKKNVYIYLYKYIHNTKKATTTIQK